MCYACTLSRCPVLTYAARLRNRPRQYHRSYHALSQYCASHTADGTAHSLSESPVLIYPLLRAGRVRFDALTGDRDPALLGVNVGNFQAKWDVNGSYAGIRSDPMKLGRRYGPGTDRCVCCYQRSARARMEYQRVVPRRRSTARMARYTSPLPAYALPTDCPVLT